MARYELSDGKSDKFWEIVVKGASFTTTYGRIGTSGQSKTKDFADAKKAKAEAEKLIGQKVKKGYAKATKSKKKAAPAKKKAAPAKKKAAPAKKGKTKVVGLRFELTDGKSEKFWEIELSGNSFETRYGRIGAKGQASTKSFASAAAAKKKHDALIAEKTKKGYVLVAGDMPKSATAKAAVNAQMEAAIAKDPTDISKRAVYADWLQGEGDPRGELAAVQLALESAKGAKKTKLKKTETQLLEDYGEFFIPPLLRDVVSRHAARKPKKSEKWRYRSWENDTLGLTWSGGFMADLDLRKSYDESEVGLGQLLDAVLSHPSSRLLTGLVVGSLNIADSYNYSEIAKRLGKAKLPALRRLHFADFSRDECEISWSVLGKMGPVWKAAPNLEEVIVFGSDFDFGKIDLPKARSFSVRTGNLFAKSFKSITAAKWPSLEKLEVWFGSAMYGANVKPKMILPLLDPARFPKLTDLGIMNAEFTDEACEMLVKSKIAKKLVRLDLSMGTLSDKGVETLVANAKAFPKLVEIDVNRNYVTPSGLKTLKKLTKKVTSKFQDTFDPDSDDYDGRRYASVGE